MSYLCCTLSPLTASLHVVDLILWSLACTVGTCISGRFHQNIFIWKTRATSKSRRSKQRHKQNNIIKAFNSESQFYLSGNRDFQSLRTCNPVQYNQYAETDSTEYNMDTKDTAEKTAPSMAAAMPAPAPKPAREPEPEALVPSVSLSGLRDDSLEGLGAAFSGLSVGGPEGKEKEKEKEKEAVDMGIEEEHPGEGQRPPNETPFEYRPSESAPSASDHTAVPSPTTTTLPATHPATCSPATTPPMAWGLGFTGMPYPTYGVTPAATVPPMAIAVSEPVASSSTYTGVLEPMPRRYEDDYHRPAAVVYMTGIPGYAAPEPCYTMPAPGFSSLSGLRGLESCGGRSRGSERSSNKSLTRSEIREALRGATSELVGDLTQEIPAKLKPLIPPKVSPTTMGASPYRLQANHLVAGLTHTLGGLRSRPMPTPVVIPRSPFVPRTPQPPYSHVENSSEPSWTSWG